MNTRKLRVGLRAAFIAAPIVFVLLLGLHYVLRDATVAASPLADGASLPPEITHLVASHGLFWESVEVRGTYQRDGREIRFITHRGPRILLPEQKAGASAYEVSGCFLNEQGRPLITVAGGHDVPIPECNAFAGEVLEPDDASSVSMEDMRLAREAMQAIAALEFAPAYRAEHNALTTVLALAALVDPVRRAFAGDIREEYGGGEVVLGEDEIPAGAGIHLP